MDRIEVLRKSDIFHYLDENDLKVVGKKCVEEYYVSGDTIFLQDKEEEKYMLLKKV